MFVLKSQLLKISSKCGRFRFITSSAILKDNLSIIIPSVSPYLEIKKKFNDLTNLEENIKRRNLNVNISYLYEAFNLYRDVEKKKMILEDQRVEIANILKENTNIDENSENVKQLKSKGKILREELQQLKLHSNELEETFISEFLKLPNELSLHTPLEDNKVIYSFKFKPDKMKSYFHMDGKDYVEYLNEDCLYLKKDAALFDIKLQSHCVAAFSKKMGLINFSNPDFLEAVCPLENLFLVKENLDLNKQSFLHLVGGGSLLSFIAFISKLSVFSSALPLEFVTSGQKYVTNTQYKQGLYTTSQSTAIQIFIATQNKKEAEQKFNNLLEEISDYYKKFNTHFRISYVSANKLESCESLKATIEMYSPHFSCYYEIGYLVYYTDYLSKRFLFNIRDKKSFDYPHIIGGTLINVTKLIAILLENNENKFSIPKFLV